MKSFVLSLLTLTLFTMNQNNWALVVDTESQKEECEVHFHFQLESLDGEWESYVHYASEDGTTVMPNDNCRKVTWFQQDTESDTVQVQQAMTVGTDNPIILGHQNGIYKDFFSVLTVTMTQKPNKTPYEKEDGVGEDLLIHGTPSSPPPKMCVFYIGATGPGQPVFYKYGFHNASCVLDSSGPGPFTLISK